MPDASIELSLVRTLVRFNKIQGLRTLSQMGQQFADYAHTELVGMLVPGRQIICRHIKSELTLPKQTDNVVSYKVCKQAPDAYAIASSRPPAPGQTMLWLYACVDGEDSITKVTVATLLSRYLLHYKEADQEQLRGSKPGDFRVLALCDSYVPLNIESGDISLWQVTGTLGSAGMWLRNIHNKGLLGEFCEEGKGRPRDYDHDHGEDEQGDEDDEQGERIYLPGALLQRCIHYNFPGVKSMPHGDYARWKFDYARHAWMHWQIMMQPGLLSPNKDSVAVVMGAHMPENLNRRAEVAQWIHDGWSPACRLEEGESCQCHLYQMIRDLPHTGFIRVSADHSEMMQARSLLSERIFDPKSVAVGLSICDKIEDNAEEEEGSGTEGFMAHFVRGHSLLDTAEIVSHRVWGGGVGGGEEPTQMPVPATDPHLVRYVCWSPEPAGPYAIFRVRESLNKWRAWRLELLAFMRTAGDVNYFVNVSQKMEHSIDFLYRAHTLSCPDPAQYLNDRTAPSFLVRHAAAHPGGRYAAFRTLGDAQSWCFASYPVRLPRGPTAATTTTTTARR